MIQPLEPLRPTIRCLREDLGYSKPPPATEPLDRLDVAILRKAHEIRQSDPPGSERIVAVNDEVFWKVKIERWRGAVWCKLPRRWLVAAGRREDGSPDDFYADLAERGRRWRREYNQAHTPPVKTDTLVAKLLPNVDDDERLVLEQAVGAVREIRAVVKGLVLDAARAGAQQQDDAAGCSLTVFVRRTDLDEVYVGITIVGSVQDNVTAVILDSVPAVADRDGWGIESSPGWKVAPGELVWSNLLDGAELDRLLHES